jgi:hypothetical protein
VVKKRVAPKKPAGKKKSKKTEPGPRPRGDRSRLDLKPLQRHIRQRIKDLKEGRGGAPLAAAAAAGESDEETIQRLESALETLEDICFPAMDIPI